METVLDHYRNATVSRGLLLAAGMYDNQPMDVSNAYAIVAPVLLQQGGYQKGHAGEALDRLISAFDQGHTVSDADLSANCGLVIIRSMLRQNPDEVAPFVVYALSPGDADPMAVPGLLQIVGGIVQQYKYNPTYYGQIYPEDLIKVTRGHFKCWSRC